MPAPLLRRLPDPDALAREAAAILAEAVHAGIAEHGRAVIGVSGGSTPGPAYALFGADASVDWSKVWIFLVDDRHVRRDSPKNNLFLLRGSLLKDAPVPESQILAPDPSLPPDECARVYGQMLSALVGRYRPDLLVLGMGDDGHIASLFPPVDASAWGPDGAIHTTTDHFDIPHRISATLPVLMRARRAVFLLKGADKQRVWAEMEGSPRDPSRWPAQEILDAMPTTVLLAP